MVRTILILALLGLCGALFAPGILAQWQAPAEVFMGRREFWWDAEDFAVFYSAGDMVASGKPHLLYTISEYTGRQREILETHEDATLGFYNPAFFALLFVPFSFLPFERAFQAWSIVNAGLIAVNCYLLWRIADRLAWQWRVALIAGFLTCYPLTFVMRLGQFSLILMASWSAAYLALRSGRDRLAGLALLPMLIKPELLIPVTIFLAWKRRWGVVRTLVPGAAVAAVVSIAMIGPAAAIDYPAYLRESAVSGTGNMYGWNGLLSATFSPDHPGDFTLIAAPLSLITFAAVALTWRGRLDTNGSDFPRQWLLLTIASILFDVHLYLQDVLLLVPAAVAVHAGAQGWRRYGTGVALAVGWFIFGLGSRPSIDWEINLISLYMVSVVAALVLAHLVREALRRGESTLIPFPATTALERSA